MVSPPLRSKDNTIINPEEIIFDLRRYQGATREKARRVGLGAKMLQQQRLDAALKGCSSTGGNGRHQCDFLERFLETPSLRAVSQTVAGRLLSTMIGRCMS